MRIEISARTLASLLSGRWLGRRIAAAWLRSLRRDDDRRRAEERALWSRLDPTEGQKTMWLVPKTTVRYTLDGSDPENGVCVPPGGYVEFRNMDLSRLRWVGDAELTSVPPKNIQAWAGP